jgi:hypothetical protein
MPTPSNVMAMLVFGLVGFIAFRSGKRENSIPRILIGLSLLIYPYFFSSGLLLWTVGAGLCAALYAFRHA